MASTSGANVLVGVSNAIVKLHKKQFGRGPTYARAEFAGPDALVCILEGALLPAERALVELGEESRVRELDRPDRRHRLRDVRARAAARRLAFVPLPGRRGFWDGLEDAHPKPPGRGARHRGGTRHQPRRAHHADPGSGVPGAAAAAPRGDPRPLEGGREAP